LRGIYPVVATIDVDGWVRLDDDDLAARYEMIAGEVSSR
jgi:proteasome beta subunit